MSSLFVPFNPNGRPPKFTPQEVLEKFAEYLKARDAAPIVIGKSVSGYTGEVSTGHTDTEEIPHPISVRDFCIFCGCGESWFRQLPDKFSSVTTYIHDYCDEYNLKGAKAGLFNANIVARQLGLVDKKESAVNVAIPEGFTKEQAKDFIAQMNK